MLAAWRMLKEPLPLKIVGDGPMAPLVRDAAAADPRIEWLGRRPLKDVYQVMGDATMLVFPSRCYETFGRVAVEAFAKGTPVIASAHGAMKDVVSDDRTGLLFEPGNAAALVDCVRRLLSDPGRLQTMRRTAREEYLAKYTGERNHQLLIGAYERARATVLQPVRIIPSPARLEKTCTEKAPVA